LPLSNSKIKGCGKITGQKLEIQRKNHSESDWRTTEGGVSARTLRGDQCKGGRRKKGRKKQAVRSDIKRTVGTLAKRVDESGKTRSHKDAAQLYVHTCPTTKGGVEKKKNKRAGP